MSIDMKATKTVGKWTSIDQAQHPTEFIDYLTDVGQIPSVRRLREETYQALANLSGVGVDVGCGAGEVIHRLAQLGIEGIGVDMSQVMVDAAQRRFVDCKFMLGSAYELPFPEAHLSWYRAERVFHLLDHPDAALAEARRVLKPAGRIMLLSPDLAATVFSTAPRYAKLARAAVSALVDLAPQGRMGTQLAQWMIEAGFKDIKITPHLVSLDNAKNARRGIIDSALSAALKSDALSAEQVLELHGDINRLDGNGAFTCTVTSFVVTAHR